MDMLIIFAGKYLIIAPALIALYVLYRQPPAARVRYAILAAIALPLAYVIAKIGNHLYINPRPFVVEDIVPLISHIPDNGFPSDHTLLASALAFFTFAINRPLGLLAMAIAAVIGIARVAAHVHHPLDIVASFAISGIALAIVAYALAALRSRGE